VMDSYYATSEIDGDAGTSTIEAAFQQLSMLYCPEECADPTAAQKCQEITNAYEILTGVEHHPKVPKDDETTLEQQDDTPLENEAKVDGSALPLSLWWSGSTPTFHRKLTSVVLILAVVAIFIFVRSNAGSQRKRCHFS
jgi:hypothetical protein